MSLEMCVLGSGSSGNATVIRSPWGVLLIDCGFGPRTTTQRLSGTGLGLNDISAICLTHLDHDHFNKNWFATLIRQGIRVYCHAERIREILESPEARDAEASPRRPKGPRLASLFHPFTSGIPFEPLPKLRMHPIRLAHDQTGSHGFLLESGHYRLGYATDLGHVPDELIERFCGVDVLALESNYDPEMERNSDRPYFLKQRIMGGAGHLSNEQAFAAVRAILDRCQAQAGGRTPRHIVLLHRSRQCNCPRIVERLFSTDGRIKAVLTLTHQSERTDWLSVRRESPLVGQQLELAWA